MTLEIPSGAQAGPEFDVDVATQAYIDLLSEEARSKSAAYVNGGYWIALAGTIQGLVLAWLLLALGWSAAMRRLAERVTRWKTVHTWLYAVQYILLTTALTFPFSVYAGFVREHRFNLATQTFPEWAGDQLKGLLITLIMGGLAITLLYAVVRRWPRRWWVGGSLTMVGLIIFSMIIAPVFIAPMFNDYKPLEPGPLRASILSMARANGVPASDVYWFDASKQTTRISANVSGLLGTTRISLNDNLLNGTSPEEVEAVMAHEIGHYVLNHGWESVIAMGLLIVIGFAFVQWGFER
ncbi:MAG: M48 family metallopeptidase, partial [Myxococcota bacterium]